MGVRSFGRQDVWATDIWATNFFPNIHLATRNWTFGRQGRDVWTTKVNR